MTLPALIERVELLTAPEREVDAELWALPGLPKTWTLEDDKLAKNQGVAYLLDIKQIAIGGASWRYAITGLDGSDWCFGIRKYTSSVDAAIALGEKLLPGQTWHLMTAALRAWSIADGTVPDLPRFYILALLRALHAEKTP